MLCPSFGATPLQMTPDKTDQMQKDGMAMDDMNMAHMDMADMDMKSMPHHNSGHGHDSNHGQTNSDNSFCAFGSIAAFVFSFVVFLFGFLPSHKIQLVFLFSNRVFVRAANRAAQSRAPPFRLLTN